MGVASVVAAGPVLPIGLALTILGLEVVQSVQTLNNSVSLIAGKRTLARIYLVPTTVASGLRLRGELAVSRGPGQPAEYVPSINSVVLQAAHPALPAQRDDLALSLNFLVPEGMLARAGSLFFQVKRIFEETGQDVPLATPVTVTLAVQAPVSIRLHCVGLRYRFNGGMVSPTAADFAHLRSFLTRAYPVSDVVWSQVVVDADTQVVPPFTDGTRLDPRWRGLLQRVHNQLAALRAADVATGTHPRTRYYGLIHDTGGFFRGAASEIPSGARPQTVAAGPCGSPRGSLAWDSDASYGDWYGAHELAHTLGRFHPGFCGDQDASDPNFPNAGGLISNPAENAFGVDLGDANLNIPMRLLPHEAHDLMTYCDEQWISPYTYNAIYHRLLAEQALFP